MKVELGSCVTVPAALWNNPAVRRTQNSQFPSLDTASRTKACGATTAFLFLLLYFWYTVMSAAWVGDLQKSGWITCNPSWWIRGTDWREGVGLLAALPVSRPSGTPIRSAQSSSIGRGHNRNTTVTGANHLQIESARQNMLPARIPCAADPNRSLPQLTATRRTAPDDPSCPLASTPPFSPMLTSTYCVCVSNESNAELVQQLRKWSVLMSPQRQLGR